MKESLAYQEILAEGRQKGQLETRRVDLLDIIETRFGKRGAMSFKPLLKAVDSPTQLRALLKLALKCSDLDELIAAAK